MPTLNREIIEAAIAGFEAQKQGIDAKIAELRGMLTGEPAKTAATAAAPKAGKSKRKFSPEAIKRMREAQQRRWAKTRGESASPAAKTTTKPKRKMSAAGRRAIAEAQRKRWAARNAA